MTAIFSAATPPASAGPFRGAVRLIGKGLHGLAAYWARRQAIKALRELDDRELRDIGIARCHIEAAVAGGLYKRRGRPR